MSHTTIQHGCELVTTLVHQGSAVHVAVVGVAGPAGERGVDGAPGAGLALRGVLTTPADLPPSAAAGDAYLIAGDLWVFGDTAWTNAGPVQGPAGSPGKDGQIRYTGYGPPPTVILGAEPHDVYLDLTTGDIYKLL